MSHPAFTSRFEIEDDGRIVVVSLTGELDPSAVEDLHPQIQELVRAGYQKYVFDLSALEHLGSIALRLFIALAKQVRREGGVVLACVPERIETLIEMTNVNRLLRSFPTRDLAIAALKPRLAGFWPLTSRFASSRRRQPRRP